MYLDGVLDNSTLLSQGSAPTGQIALGIGTKINNTADPTQSFAGEIDCLRITQGADRWVGAFTPPVSIAEYITASEIATVAALCPIQTLVAIGTFSEVALASLTSTKPTLVAKGHNSYGEQAAILTAPIPTLSITTGANSGSAAPSPTLSTTGTVTQLATAALTPPSTSIIASGTVSGTSNAALRAPVATLVGYGGAVCSVTITGRTTLSATGTTGSVGGAQLTCPLFQLSASGTAQNHGSASLLAPSAKLGTTAQAWLVAPGAQLTAIGSAVVTATYEAYAVNLKHDSKPGVLPIDEMTHNTNFPFTHVVRYQNSYYGANSTGLYLLEGTTDDATPITWAVKTATTDFKSPTLKTVASAYFGGRLGSTDTITLHAGEGAQTQTYSYTTPRGPLAQNYRQAFGKGIRHHRYYALAATGIGEMALDDISLDVHNLSRRI